MTARAVVPFAAVLLAAGLPVAHATGQQPDATAPANYVVHEWGTFTSMAGGDGAVLEGLPRQQIERALPLMLAPEPKEIVRVLVGRSTSAALRGCRPNRPPIGRCRTNARCPAC
jgi:hypothetical protein